MEFDIPQNFITILIATITITQKLKNSPWMLRLIATISGHPEISGMGSVVLSTLIPILIGILQVVTDGSISTQEVMTLLAAWLGANGAHGLVKKNEED